MDWESIFSLCGAIAMVGWAALVLLPKLPFVVNTLTRWLIPGLIGVVYVYLMATNFGSAPATGGFGSLAEVKSLFTVDALLLGGWVHYLAFDLFVGSWEVRDGQREGIHHLLLIPCLAATLMAGPAGLLLYLLLKYTHRAVRGSTRREAEAGAQ